MRSKVIILSIISLIIMISGISYTDSNTRIYNESDDLLQAEPDDGLGEDDGLDGDSFSETPHLTPIKNIMITVSDDEEDDEPREMDDYFGYSLGTTYEGVITRIVDGTRTYEAEDVKISKTIFENDTNFEAKTYDYARLFRLLGDKLNNPGTLSEAAVIVMRTTDDQKKEIKFKDILQIDYPRTWLDIFNSLVPNNPSVKDAVDSEKPVQLLVALRNFREEYIQELTSEVEDEVPEIDVDAEEDDEEDLSVMSSLMRNTIKDQILKILKKLRELLPNNYQIYLELGDYYHAESMFNEELAVYMLALNRGVQDTKGEIASRLGRFYLEVLDLPDQALESFSKIMFWYCTRTNQHFASELIPPAKSPFADTPEYAEAEVSEEYANTPVIFRPPSSAALTSAVLKVKALITVKEYQKAKNLIYILRDLFNRMADDFELQSLIPLDRSLESFVYECAMLLGETWFNQGELYFAEKEFLKIPQESTFYVTARIKLCQIYYYEKRHVDIRRALADLRQFDPMFRQANRYNKLPDPAQDPDSFDPYEYMPDKIEFNSDYSKALCLNAMIYLNPPLNSRNSDLQNMPQPKQKIIVQSAIQAMFYDPMNYEPYLIIADYASRSTDVETRNQTVKWIDRALALSPNNPVILYNLAFYYATSKDLNVKSFDKAREILRKIIELAPDYSDAYVLLGEMHFKLAEWKESKDPNEAAEHYRNAKNYFNNALMLSPKRIDVRMKLGHCYMTQIESIKNNIQRLWSQHQELPDDKQIKDSLLTELGALEQLLDKAKELFNIEHLSKPVVLDVLTETDRGTPQFILSKGADAGVNPTLRFRVRTTRGFELKLKPLYINSVYTTTEVEDYKTDPDVPLAVLDLQRTVEELGETVFTSEIIHQKMAKRKNDDVPDFSLYDDYAVEAWASTGYIYFNMDFIEGYREQLLGRTYTKGENFELAEEYLTSVIKYCETYKSGKSNIPAYQYALKAREEIERTKKLTVWSDNFKRPINGQKTNVIGNQWSLNVDKDPHMFFVSQDEKPGLIVYTQPDDFCSGDVTTITRNEDEILFMAIEMSCNVRKESLMPEIGELQYGFVINVNDKETEKLMASLSVRVSPIDKKIIVVTKDDKDADKTELVLPDRRTPSSILKLRLERRFVDKQAQFFLVIDDNVEVQIKSVPNYLKTQIQAAGNNVMSVGLSLVGTNNKPVSFAVNKINIIKLIPE